MDEINMPVPAAVLKALKSGDKTAPQLAKACNLKLVVVKTSLTRLCFLGKVRPKADKYSLIEEKEHA